MPTLTIQRDKGWVDKIRKYHILLDGAKIGKLGEDEVLRQQISDGPHVIQARIDWCGSRPLRFETLSEDSVVLVRSALRGWAGLFGFFYVTFNRLGYLTLEFKQ